MLYKNPKTPNDISKRKIRWRTAKVVVVPGVMVVGGAVGMLVIVVGGGRSPQKKGSFFPFRALRQMRAAVKSRRNETSPK